MNEVVFTEEQIHQIALTLIPGIGSVQARLLVEALGSASDIFKASTRQLSAVEGIGTIKASAIKKFEDFQLAEAELAFCNKHHITPLFLTNEQYPQKMLNSYDAPAVLYYRGNADLNTLRAISIIGTRNNTDYGKQITEQIVEELQPFNPLIVSGLAYGIDAIAHKAALKQGLSTIGVLAHGLDTIYPAQHKGLAKEMLQQGGLLTEFGKATQPDRHNFPRRNRIVAGMCDAVIVIETAAKGGSMITAEIAYSYNRDLFAVPGKITDAKSGGCLKLIQQQKAMVFTSVEQMAETLGWQQRNKHKRKQKELFVQLSADEEILMKVLQSKELVGIDELYQKSGLSSSSVAAAMLNLELQNLIIALPGKMFRLS